MEQRAKGRITSTSNKCIGILKLILVEMIASDLEYFTVKRLQEAMEASPGLSLMYLRY